MLKPQLRSSPWSPHIMRDGRPNTLTKTQAKLNIIKGEGLVRQLMTVGLSKSANHKPNPIGIQGIGIQINACKYVTRGRKHIVSTWSSNTCRALPLVAAQSLLLEGLEYYQSL
jgi:hypothetical protein